MTCIVGFVKDGTVWIGGDSAGVAGWDIRTRMDPKVFVKGQFIYGYTSSFRMGQLLQYAFTPPARERDEDVRAYMYGRWIESVRKCFKDHGYASVVNNVDHGGNFLVGYEGLLFEVEGDFQIGEYSEPYNAVGCGAHYALGACHALAAEIDDPSRLIERALETAEHFSAGVRAPFIIETL